jgi:hypothetical protein
MIFVACAGVFVALMPVLLRYRDIQNQLLLTRSFSEIEAFSADLTGILSATPIMALWRVPSLASNGEAEIYLGIFAPLLVLTAIVWPRRTATSWLSPRWRAVRLAVATAGAAYALIAAGTLFGSWSVRLGPLTVSASQTVQPLSIAVLCVILLALTSPTVTDAFRRRSAFAFYTLAALMTWSFTLGPRPTFLGQPLLYRGPYEFLMLFPGFDNRLRVPARFVMMTVLAVAVAAGMALTRLTASAPRAVRLAFTIVLLVAIAADSWTFTCPMPSVPAFGQLPSSVPASAAVLELPLGNVGPDIAAVYRSIGHGHAVVNGYSGYEPPHYGVLKAGLGERDDSVLTALTRFAPIAVRIANQDDPGGGLAEYVGRHARAVRLEDSADHHLFLLPATQADENAGYTFERTLPIRGATFNFGVFDLKAVTDGNPETIWVTPKPQRGGEELLIELEDVRTVSGVALSTGSAREGYPRSLSIATSRDGQMWDDGWTGGIAGLAVEGILRNPRTAESRIAFPSRAARFIRLRQLGAHPDYGWFIAELKIYGSGIS